MKTEYAIELVNISKAYPGVQALDGVSFGVKANSVHALIGPNGAGKSTCMKIMAGLIRPSSGEVRKSSTCTRVVLLPDHIPLYPHMRVREYLEFVAAIHGVPASQRKPNVENAIALCAIADVADRLCRNLSTGQRQKVGVAQALVFDAPVVILDEPTAGLDPIAIQGMRDLIKGLADGRTVVVSTHLLHEVEQLCDHATILDHGKVARTGTLAEILRTAHGEGARTANVRLEITGFQETLLNQIRDQLGLIQYHVRLHPDGTAELHLVLPADDHGQAPTGELAKILVGRGHDLISMQSVGADIESAFRQATQQVEGRV